MLTKSQIESLTRAQVWQHINDNQLDVKKHLTTTDSRQSLIDYYGIIITNVQLAQDDGIVPLEITQVDIYSRGIFPKLSKDDSLGHYRAQPATVSISIRVSHQIKLSTADYDKFATSLLSDHIWLAGLGGHGSVTSPLGNPKTWTPHQQDAYRIGAYQICVEISAQDRETILVNPQYCDHARYCGMYDTDLAPMPDCDSGIKPRVNRLSTSVRSLQELIVVSKMAKTANLMLSHRHGLLTSTAVGSGVTVSNQAEVTEINGSWLIAVDSTFTSFVKKLNSSEFVSIDNQQLDTIKVLSDQGSLEIDASDNYDLPEPLEFRGRVTDTFTCGAESLIRAIKNLSPCRSMTNSTLSSILVRTDGLSAVLTATDGARLAIACVELIYNCNPPSPFTVTIPAQTIQALLSIPADLINGAKVTLDTTKSHTKITFSNSKLSLVCLRPSDIFANVDPVIAQVEQSPTHRFKFDSGLVRERLKLLSSVTELADEATVTLTLDTSGHAHMVASDLSHTADVGFEYSGVPVDRRFEFNYGYFMQGIGAENEPIELTCPDNVPFVKLSTQTFSYYLAQIV